MKRILAISLLLCIAGASAFAQFAPLRTPTPAVRSAAPATPAPAVTAAPVAAPTTPAPSSAPVAATPAVSAAPVAATPVPSAVPVAATPAASAAPVAATPAATAAPVAATPAASANPVAAPASPAASSAPVAGPTTPAPGNDPSPNPVVVAAPVIHEATTDHYRVYSEISLENAQQAATHLEATFVYLNGLFRFPAENLKAKLKVKIFSSKAKYDEYLNRIIGQTREDFIYLHYSDVEKSELAGYMFEGPSFLASLNHQAFIQFLRAFVAQPPLWMREGFAVYFEKLEYNAVSGKVEYRENLGWLETVKQFADPANPSLLPLSKLLSIDVEEAKTMIDVFYPEAWAFVSFLMNTADREMNRLLWDSIKAMKPDASLAQNVEYINKASFRWITEDQLGQSFIDYLGTRKTFRGLVQEGIELYSKDKLADAEALFKKALEMEPTNYVPLYYIGLISYATKNYGDADKFYKAALDSGAAPALTYYAMGVNAYADNRFKEATGYLQLVKDLDPAYAPKADEILQRMAP